MGNNDAGLGNMLANLSAFLHSIQFEQYFAFGVLFLFAVACIVRLIRTTMILVSPNGYSRDHNRVIGSVSQIAFWFALVFEVQIWLFGADEMLTMFQSANKLVGLIHIGLMVLTLLLAGISMLFRRNGKRAYISRALCKSSIVLAVEGAAVYLAGFFMIP